MTKIAPARITAFLRRPDPAARAILVYGPDAGLVRERAEALAATVCPDRADPFRVAELAPRTLADDPGRLADEAAALAFGGGRRVVWVRGAGDGVADACQAFLDHPTGEALIVVEAGDLKAGSRLRAAFEGAAAGAALACYLDDGANLDDLIQQVLVEHRVTPEALALLRQSLGADRALSRRELEKLALYLGDQTEVTVETVQAVVGDAAAVTLDGIAFAAAEGDSAGLDLGLARAWREGLAPVAVVRGTLRHFQRLHRAAAAMERGMSAEAAVAALRPAPFYRARGRITAQAARWPRHRLDGALQFLLEAEMDCKTTGYPDRAITGRVLLRLAAAARAAAGRR
ncbi:MAG: DNA polymerase III subunit delta [Alphaproteobacteria bacterium]|nr:DNA polymerase III subunit delta [Alphaproteobacteria bacterium]